MRSEFRGPGSLVLTQQGLAAPPIYYAIADDASLVWGTDPAEIAACPRVPTRLDPASLVASRVLGFIPDDRTPFLAVRRVPVGATLTAESRRNRVRVSVSSARLPEPEDGDLLALLQDVVTRELADGGAVLLSGGVDSTILAALAVRAGASSRGSIRSVVGDGTGDASRSDREAAEKVARALGLELLRAPVTGGDDPLGLWARIVHRSASFAHPSGTIQVAARAVPDAPVLLCGEGADELFAGYWWVYPHPRLFVAGLGRRLAELGDASGRLPPTGTELADRIRGWQEMSGEDRFRSIYLMNITERLPSLHIRLARAEARPIPISFPFCDPAVAAWALFRSTRSLVNNGQTKLPLRELVRELLPGKLAGLIVDRPKSTLPDSSGGLRDQVAAECQYLAGAKWDRHPMRWLFPDPLSMLTADMFWLQYGKWRGTIPDGFRWRDMYREFDPRTEWQMAAPDLVLWGEG